MAVDADKLALATEKGATEWLRSLSAINSNSLSWGGLARLSSRLNWESVQKTVSEQPKTFDFSFSELGFTQNSDYSRLRAAKYDFPFLLYLAGLSAYPDCRLPNLVSPLNRSSPLIFFAVIRRCA